MRSRFDTASPHVFDEPRDGFLFGAFLAVLVWAPIPLGSNRPIAWFLLAALLFMLAAGWLVQFARGRVGVTPALYSARWALLFLGIWTLWIAIQALPLPQDVLSVMAPRVHDQWLATLAGHEQRWVTLSLAPHATREALTLTLAYGIGFVLTLLLVRDERRLRQLMWAFVIAGTAQAGYGALMTLSGVEWGFLSPKESYIGRATGTFINRNHLAGYLQLCLAMGLGLLIAEMSSWRLSRASRRAALRDGLMLVLSSKTLLRLALIVMVLGLVLTRSRMGNTAFAIALFSVALFALMSRGLPRRTTMVVIASVVVIDVAVIGAWFGTEKVVERISTTTMSNENRDEVTQLALEAWHDYPITGTGLGTFSKVFPAYRDSSVAAFYYEAHNDYAQFLLETGLIGTLTLGAFLLLTLTRAADRTLRAKQRSSNAAGLAVIMGGTAYLVHATVEFNFQIPANALGFMVLAALAWSPGHNSRRNRHHTAIPRPQDAAPKKTISKS